MTGLVIFDLDGTLLNTIDDLAISTNYALSRCGFPEHDKSEYPYFVGNGINKLFERALPEGERTSENIAYMRRYFLDYYSDHNTDYTVPYPGIKVLLSQLVSRGISLAVASNKYQEGTTKLINHYFGALPFAAVFGQREGVPPKPDPAIINDILRKTGIRNKANVLYVGDSGVDMRTARNAGLRSVGVTWGFRSQTELRENGADVLAGKPEDILRFL